jgi:hypothetical protein
MMANNTKFYKKSTEHAGIQVGDKFRLIKDHHEVHGDLPKDSVTVLMSISHFPTMYYLKDLETGRTFTVPLHSVERMP